MSKFSTKVSVTGLRDCMRRVAKLKRGVRNKLIRKAMSKSTQPLAKAAKSRAPKRFGLLQKSLGRKMKTYSKSGTVVAIVGPRSGFQRPVPGRGKNGKRRVANPLYYAHLVEKGTRPHSLGKGSRLRGKKARQSGAMHPGARPRPFLGPAWRAGRAKVESTFRNELWAGIQQESK